MGGINDAAAHNRHFAGLRSVCFFNSKGKNIFV